MRYFPTDCDRVLREVKEIMQKRKGFRRHDITLTALAGELNVSRSLLSRTINQNMGMTYGDYLNMLRTREVERMLANNRRGLSLEKITFLSGFSCPSMYYRYKKKTEAKKTLALKTTN